ncbi:MAG TPA: sulfotransferase [Gaiellales bacterium]
MADEEVAMPLRMVGAGLGRTGTHSLKLALERLIGEPCYHMSEVFGKDDHVAAWKAAGEGSFPEWDALLAGYGATVDWPACAYWEQLAAAYPEAPVLLSVRSSPAAWWASIEQTIAHAVSQPPRHEQQARTRAMVTPMLQAFCPGWPERDAVIEAYERHNDRVRREVPAGRLVEWQPGDGWEPLCTALAVPVPEEPFPHVNTASEFRAAMEPETPPAAS